MRGVDFLFLCVCCFNKISFYDLILSNERAPVGVDIIFHLLIIIFICVYLFISSRGLCNIVVAIRM